MTRPSLPAQTAVPGNGNGATKKGTVPGTVAVKALKTQEVFARARDTGTSARLLDLDGVAAYLNVSRWTAEELIRGGQVPVTRIPRPRTARALKHDPEGDELRLLRVDRVDLDEFISTHCRKERMGAR